MCWNSKVEWNFEVEMVLFHTFEGRGKLEEGEKDGMNCKEDKKFLQMWGKQMVGHPPEGKSNSFHKKLTSSLEQVQI